MQLNTYQRQVMRDLSAYMNAVACMSFLCPRRRHKDVELARSLGISLAAGNDRSGIQRVLRDQYRGDADGPVQG